MLKMSENWREHKKWDCHNNIWGHMKLLQSQLTPCHICLRQLFKFFPYWMSAVTCSPSNPSIFLSFGSWGSWCLSQAVIVFYRKVACLPQGHVDTHGTTIYTLTHIGGFPGLCSYHTCFWKKKTELQKKNPTQRQHANPTQKTAPSFERTTFGAAAALMITRSATFLKFNNSCWNKQTAGVILGEGRGIARNTISSYLPCRACVWVTRFISPGTCVWALSDRKHLLILVSGVSVKETSLRVDVHSHTGAVITVDKHVDSSAAPRPSDIWGKIGFAASKR